jgi:hypothetical protein
MNKFNIKSILLGIGIGIIITSIASMIYFAGRDPLSGLSKEEIISQAEKYGMVMNPEPAQEEPTGIFKVDSDITTGE